MTTDIVLKKIKTFCKSNKIDGFKIQKLYHKFITAQSISESIITQNQFEQGLKTLNKKIIKDLIKICEDFSKNWKGDKPYEAFIANREFITREFWDSISEDKKEPVVRPEPAKDLPLNEPLVLPKPVKEPPPRPLGTAAQPGIKSNKQRLPPNWDRMTLTERMKFVNNIENDNEFKKYVMALDPRIEKYAEKWDNRLKKNPVRLYITVFSFSAEKTSLETKNLIKKFVDALNQFGKGRLQYIEMINPPVVEIREVRS